MDSAWGMVCTGGSSAFDIGLSVDSCSQDALNGQAIAESIPAVPIKEALLCVIATHAELFAKVIGRAPVNMLNPKCECSFMLKLSQHNPNVKSRICQAAV